MRFDLTSEERTILLKAARNAIRQELDGEERSSAHPMLTQSLETPCGVFVTLNKDSALRGCVGYTEAVRSLYEAVLSAAKGAAFKDNRFAPVTADEIGSIEIEISVLEPAEAIDSWEDIVIGEHGIIMEHNEHRALFLPDVPTQYGWDLPTTLKHLARKAGIGEGSWRSDASFHVFKSIKFGESV